MIYKRATKKIKAAGINHIVITKGIYGPYPYDLRGRRQTSKCFTSWQEAAQAVINGYRPTVTEFK